MWALRHGSVISRMLRWCRHRRTWTSIPRFKDTTLLPSLFLSSGDLFFLNAIVIVVHVHTFDLLLFACGLRLKRQESIQCLISASHLKI